MTKRDTVILLRDLFYFVIALIKYGYSRPLFSNNLQQLNVKNLHYSIQFCDAI